MCTRAGSFARFLPAVGLLLFLSPGSESHNSVARQCSSNVPTALHSQAHPGCPHPVDASTAREPIDWSPWTHPPECLEAELSPTTKYCVFTNSQHGNGGVSFITTPEIAADSADILNDSGYTHTKSFINNTAGVAYEIRDIPRKGKGLIAMRRIKRAEVIVADWAALIVNINFPTSVRRAQGYRLLHRATDQLSDPDTVLELAHRSSISSDIIEDILRTNAFSCMFHCESITPVR